MIGKTISHYRITAELGAGGMGIVYKAEDTTLKREVALKFLPPEIARDEAARARFVHEAQAAAALDHPNICTVYEIQQAEGHTFIAMPLVEGESLRDRIARGPLPVDAALDITIQVARGLAKAHQSDIVHRDIKPGNVLLTDDGTAKIVDFGLAKLAGQTRLTRTGTTLGTVAYMSPEQVRGSAVDHRTDIWALGVILYEMLTGQLPFRGEIDQAVMHSILNVDPEPVGTTRREVPVALEDVAENAIAKDPEKRFQNVTEMLASLETIRDELQLGITRRRYGTLRRLRRKRRAVTWGAAALLIVAATVVLTVLLRHTPAIDSIAVLPVANLSGDPDQEYFSDGITAALISELSQISALRVISRTSVMQYKEHPKSLRDIARDLAVGAVVEASVLREGDRVRVTAQLIQADPEQQLWGDSFDRQLKDVFSLYSDIARAIAEKIQVTVTPEEAASLTHEHPVDPVAYEAYLKGNAYADKWGIPEFEKSFAYFEQAIAQDSTYAPAYAGLAMAYADAHIFYLPHDIAYPKLKEAATKASKLDAQLAESHIALGMLRSIGEWDWERSEAAFKRALEIDPRNEIARQEYGCFLTYMGRVDEAVAQLRQAVELAPLSLFINQNLGWAYYHSRRTDEAITQFQKTLELITQFPDPLKEKQIHRQLLWCYTMKGMFEQAFTELEIISEGLDPDSPRHKYAYDRIWLYVASGRRDEIAEVITEVLAQNTLDIHPWTLAALGETDRLIENLTALYESHSAHMLFINISPGLYGPVRSDLRFQELLQRMNFPR